MSISSLDFVAVDVQTANAKQASVCAVGIALVRAGEVVATEKILVQPPTGPDSFSALNRGIHGIGAEDVREAPEWDEVAGQLEVLGTQLPLVAHNAAADRGAYEAACAETGRTAQPMEWLDLLELSRRLRPDSRQHTLPALAEAYGVSLADHHDAEQDARACAEVLVAIAQEQGVGQLGQLWPEDGQVRTAAAYEAREEGPEEQTVPEAGPEVASAPTPEPERHGEPHGGRQAGPEAPARPADERSSYTPSALRRSHFNDDGPRPWERPAPSEEGHLEHGHYPVYGGAQQDGAPVERRDSAGSPASPAQVGGAEAAFRVARKAAGVVVMLIALFCVLMAAAGVGQVVEHLSAGESGDVGIDVALTAVCAMISIWLATTSLRWMRG